MPAKPSPSSRYRPPMWCGWLRLRAPARRRPRQSSRLATGAHGSRLGGRLPPRPAGDAASSTVAMAGARVGSLSSAAGWAPDEAADRAHAWSTHSREAFRKSRRMTTAGAASSPPAAASCSRPVRPSVTKARLTFWRQAQAVIVLISSAAASCRQDEGVADSMSATTRCSFSGAWLFASRVPVVEEQPRRQSRHRHRGTPVRPLPHRCSLAPPQCGHVVTGQLTPTGPLSSATSDWSSATNQSWLAASRNAPSSPPSPAII